MRLSQKKQILELIATLWKAFDEIVNMADKQQYSEAKELLADCQNGAVAIGTAIEKLAGEGLPVIEKLEEYCELLYQIHGQLEDSGNLSKMLKMLRKKLSQINSGIEKDIPIQYEIVFMPYKASMWDSMESIWYSAKEDERCDCYVVPIPYYIFNSQIAIEKTCYEGDELPDYVPVTDYKKYHLDLRKPDVIYIHNPYDQYNYVTSVLPKYYSTNLKKNTQRLVYVPYFMTNGKVPDGIRKLPTYSNMDKIVMQSKRQKQLYLPHVSEAKLLPLGSPKADRAIYYKEHKPPMPKEWEEMIGDKKLIMFNSSLSGVLTYREKAFNKMQSVFSYFENRDDAVLLWRPHPLLRDTIQSMLPAFLEEYDEIKKRFVEEKRGILDTTVDITKSAALCDAYIGEENSSVVTIFGVMGKPVFILDVNITSNSECDEMEEIEFFDCYAENETIWFVTNDFNLLCRMDLNTGQIEIKTQLEKNSGIREDFCNIIKWNERFIVHPYHSPAIIEYDRINNIITKKEIPKAICCDFCNMILYKEDIFLIPSHYPAIVKYNLMNRNLDFYQAIITEFPVDCYGSNSRFRAAARRDNKILMLSTSDSKALEFNMDTKEMRVLSIGNLNYGFFDMIYDGKDYWLTPYYGKGIIRWNYETGEVLEYSDLPEEYISEKECFSHIVYGKSSIFIFSGLSHMVLTIELATGRVSEFPISDPELEAGYQDMHGKWAFAKKINDNQIVGMIAGKANRLVVINSEAETYQIYSCNLERKNFEKYLPSEDRTIKYKKVEEGVNISYFCYENSIQTMNEFVKYVSDEKHNADIQKSVYHQIVSNLEGTCGKEVHKEIMREIL